MYKKIQELCKDNSISVTELERILGFGNGTIHRWSNASPTIDKVKAVAVYFNISVDQLISDDEIPSQDALQIANEYISLTPAQKNLVKCYMSIVKAGRTDKVV